MARITIAFLQERLAAVRAELVIERHQHQKTIHDCTLQVASYNQQTREARIAEVAAQNSDASSQSMIKTLREALDRTEAKLKHKGNDQLSDAELMALGSLVASELRQETDASIKLRAQLELRGVLAPSPSPWGAVAGLGLAGMWSAIAKHDKAVAMPVPERDR